VVAVDPPVVAFAGLLRQLRMSAGLSQEELAEAAGVGVRTVSDLERGVALTARKDTARLLADALNLTGPERASFEAIARGRAATGVSAVPGGGLAGVDGVAAATRALPRDIGSFTGRQPELRQLVGATAGSSRPGVVSIHAIGGMAGIGKTALAVHAAHQLAPRFPDGQIFLPLHGHTPGQRPVDPADALASLLLTAGVPAARIPPGLEARTALWRDRLAGKQLLLLLDDAAGSDQVRPLLPGSAGNLVLVTSRRHLTALEDAQTVSLDILPASHAAELLVRLAGRPDLDPGGAEVAEITRLCGYLPLAVGMLARQLHHHPAWTAAGLVADLAAARDRLQLLHAENLSVAAAFDLSYQDLTSAQQRLFRRLGLHPGTDTDSYAAAALDGTELAVARRNLEALYDHYLIAEPLRGRYRFHDLIREHARALAERDDPASGREQATDRLLDYYQYAAALAEALLARHVRPAARAGESLTVAIPALANEEQALAWARAERANLLACLDHASGTSQHARVIAFTAGLAGLFHLLGTMVYEAGELEQAETMLAEGSEAAEAARLPALQARIRLRLTELHAMQGGPSEETLAECEAAIAILETAGDIEGLAEAWQLTGMARWWFGHSPADQQALEHAMAYARQAGHRRVQMEASSWLAWSFVWLPIQADTALTRAEQLLQTADGEPGAEADILVPLSLIYAYVGRFADARGAIARAQSVYDHSGTKFKRAYGAFAAGQMEMIAGEPAAAEQHLREAYETLHAMGERGWLSSVAGMLAEALYAQGLLAEAQQMTQEAQEAAAPRDVEAQALWRAARAKVLARSGQFPAARVLLDEAAALVSPTSWAALQAEVLLARAEVDRLAGAPEHAEASLRTALRIYQDRHATPLADRAAATLASLTGHSSAKPA
jgi:tetratricopeptide (TPR) repeat protein/DNA-binding XRE family transcriptional regulator